MTQKTAASEEDRVPDRSEGQTRAARGRLLREGIKRLWRIRELGLLIVVIVVFTSLSLVNEEFFTRGNLIPTLVGMSPLLIVSVGMTLALISGAFDLSVGGVVALATVFMAYLVKTGTGPELALLLTLLAALSVGLFNGILIAKIGINPLIATLGTLGIARGLALIISRGTTITPPSQELEGWFTWFGRSEVGGIPTLIPLVLGLVLVGDILVRRARVFRNIYLLGGSERAAKFMGIKVARVRIWVFLATALLSATAGLLLLSRFGSATAEFGRGYELQAIAAAVIGGASLKGGSGSILGVFLAAFLLAMVQSALVLNRVSVFWQEFITGTILVVAVAITVIGDRGSLLQRD